MNTRAIAANVILKVLNGASLSDALAKALTKIPEQRDQAFVQAICFGVCRRYFYLDAVLFLLLDKPLNEKDEDIFALLLVGLYQLIEMRLPTYAAVAETVNAVLDFDKPWAKGLVNAILRSYDRNKTEVEVELAEDEEAQASMPAWLMGKIHKAWGEQAKDIFQASNAHPPLTLRVNKARLTRDAYMAELAATGHEAVAIPATESGVRLAVPVDVKILPGFQAGDVSVQDGAAQLAAELMQLAPHQRVLDACAAPGGKTAHMLEREPTLSLVAIDKDKVRLRSVEENLQRLHLSAECIAADAAEPAKWWDNVPFDRILIDAPCSATGVIRRHPDIKLLRRPEDITQFVSEQKRLLEALWPLLVSQGLLVYATCSLLPQENVDVIMSFLAEHSDATAEKMDVTWGIPCEVGRQVLPGMLEMDGFYYACLRKI